MIRQKEGMRAFQRVGGIRWSPPQGLLGSSGLAQSIKNLPAMQKTWVRSLGQKYPLENIMATHCSILAWRIPWTEEPGGLPSMGLQSQTRLSNFHTHTHTHTELSSSDRKSICFEGKKNLVWKLQAGSLCLFPKGCHVGWSTDQWDRGESPKYRSKDRHRNLTHTNGGRENSSRITTGLGEKTSYLGKIKLVLSRSL